MPDNPRPGRKGVYIELPEGLLAALDERAATDRRARTTVVIMALEQHLGVKAEQPKRSPKKGRQR